jgi:ATP-binding cassette subfamily B protein
MRGHLWPYARTQAWLIVGGVFALFAEIAPRLLEPWPLKIVFDDLLVPDAAASAVPLP